LSRRIGFIFHDGYCRHEKSEGELPAGREEKGTDRPAEWRPFESLRREVDRPFEDFQLGSWRSPFGRREWRDA